MAKGMKMMGTLRLVDNSVPPFGAEIYNADGVSVAMVLEDGKAWLAGINANETLNVMWGQTAVQSNRPAWREQRTFGHASAVPLIL